MILADSSIWIDHLRGPESAHVMRLRSAMAAREILVGDLIMMEVLQGVRDDLAARRVRTLLSSIPAVRLVRAGIPLKAAENFRSLRRRGFTPRNAIDTMIATYCIEYGLELLHNDRDFEPFERHLGLKVVHADA